MSTTNGKPQRKQLSDQLDRLDAILDCLAEGLPGAVADAAREGVRQAVKEAITEILTHPELLTAVRTTAEATGGPAMASEPSTSQPWDRLKSVRDAIAVAAERTVTVVRVRFWQLRGRLAAAVQPLGNRITANRTALIVTLLTVVWLVNSLPISPTTAVVGVGTAAAMVGIVVTNRIRRVAECWGLV